MISWNQMLEGVAPVPLAGTLCRLVESQEQVATQQLVGSLARQLLLEQMLDATKPPLRAGTERLHYLLATPFRYPPLKHGSRFGTRGEPSLFYGSLDTATVLAEAAYYRFVFWYGMTQPPPRKLDTQHTLFGVKYRTATGLRLQDSPFSACRQQLCDPTDYRTTQTLGALLRASGIQAFEFSSARALQDGLNVALFTPAAFAGRRPVFQDAWLCELTGHHVRFCATGGTGVHEFDVQGFEVDGVLPHPP
jgi:hypothetical protein